MNFLAHLYLSGNNEELLIGNFIGDSVKGNSFKTYTKEIQRGVVLHRLIDSFTDSHAIVEESKARLRPKYHKYAPVIVDMYYDHFLARNWSDYSKVDLDVYTNFVHDLLQKNIKSLPQRTQYMLPYMISGDWLMGYRELEGIDRALTGMARRTKFESKMELATQDLKADYKLYENEFRLFFPELINFVEEHLAST